MWTWKGHSLKPVTSPFPAPRDADCLHWSKAGSHTKRGRRRKDQEGPATPFFYSHPVNIVGSVKAWGPRPASSLSLEGSRLAVSACPQITPLLCWSEGCWAPPSELPTAHGLALTWALPLAVFVLKRLPNMFIKLPLRLYQEEKKIGDS